MTHPIQNTNGVLSPLPVEIHLSIIDYLDYTARVALAHTNHYFNEIVVRQPPTTREGKLEFVCEAETWPMFVSTVERLGFFLLLFELTRLPGIQISIILHVTNA
jgi:hypothetical protein